MSAVRKALVTLAEAECEKCAEDIRELLSIDLPLPELVRPSLYESVFHVDYNFRIHLLKEGRREKDRFLIPVLSIQEIWESIFGGRQFQKSRDSDDWLLEKIATFHENTELQESLNFIKRDSKALFAHGTGKDVDIELKLRTQHLLETGKLLERLKQVEAVQQAPTSSLRGYSSEIIQDLLFITQLAQDLIQHAESPTSQKSAKETSSTISFDISKVQSPSYARNLADYPIVQALLSDNLTEEVTTAINSRIWNLLDQINYNTPFQSLCTMSGSILQSVLPVRYFFLRLPDLTPIDTDSMKKEGKYPTLDTEISDEGTVLYRDAQNRHRTRFFNSKQDASVFLAHTKAASSANNSYDAKKYKVGEWTALELSLVIPNARTPCTLPKFYLDPYLRTFNASVLIDNKTTIREKFPVIEGQYLRARYTALSWLHSTEQLLQKNNGPVQRNADHLTTIDRSRKTTFLP